MRIQANRETQQVVGLNGPTTPLYLEVTLPDDVTLTKQVETQEGEVQKTDDAGQPLYKLEAVGDDGETTTLEVTYAQVEIDGDDGETLTVDLEPVTVPNMVKNVVAIQDNPQAFTLGEVIAAKFKGLLEASSCDYIVADVFLDESDLDLADEHHAANTGYGILQLLPQGQAKTKPVDLAKPTTLFKLLELDADPGVEVYVAGYKIVDGAAALPTAVNSCTIKFVNTTDKPRSVRSYAIGY